MKTKELKTTFEKRRVTSGQKALTKSQVNKLLACITNIENQALFTLAIYTGIRREDIVNIKRNDVDLENHFITFYESKKSNIHRVFLNAKVEQALSMWINAAPKSKWLFPSPRNPKKNRSGRSAYDQLQKLCKWAGIKKTPFHALRATCIKLHQSAGLSENETARILNDSVNVIQKHYSTPSDEEMKSKIRGVNILWKKLKNDYDKIKVKGVKLIPRDRDKQIPKVVKSNVQYLEREITLSLLNAKLNYITELLEKICKVTGIKLTKD